MTKGHASVTPLREPSRGRAAGAAAVIVLALALRLWGLGFGLPHAYHQDEPIVVNYALAIGATGWDTGRYMPPQFASYLLFLVYGVFFAAGKLFGLFKDTTDFALHFFRDPTAFYLLGRFFLGALFGTATVALLYRTTERFFSASAAPLAALFLAVLPLHVQQSHYLYMDAAVTFATLLFFHLLFSWFEAPSRKAVLLAGAAFGFAVSVKYTAAYFAPSVLLVFVLLERRELGWPRRFWHAALFGAAALAAYATVSPYSFVHWGDFIAEVRLQSGSDWRRSFGWSFHFAYSILEGTGWLWAALSLTGVWAACRGHGRKALILVSAVLVYYAVNAHFTQPYPRYMMPVLPIFCLFAALAAGSFTRGRSVILAFAIAELFAVSAYADWQMAQKDTRSQATEWILKNIPSGTAIAVDSRAYGPRLAPTKELIRQKGEEAGGDEAKRKRAELLLLATEGMTTYAPYLLSDNASDQEGLFSSRPLIGLDPSDLVKHNVRFVVKNYFERGENGRPTAKQAFIDSIADKTLVASFTPYRDPSRKWESDLLIGTACQPHRRSDALVRTRPGPYLEIYRLKEDF